MLLNQPWPLERRQLAPVQTHWLCRCCWWADSWKYKILYPSSQRPSIAGSLLPRAFHASLLAAVSRAHLQRLGWMPGHQHRIWMRFCFLACATSVLHVHARRHSRSLQWLHFRFLQLVDFSLKRFNFLKNVDTLTCLSFTTSCFSTWHEEHCIIRRRYSILFQSRTCLKFFFPDVQSMPSTSSAELSALKSAEISVLYLL